MSISFYFDEQTKTWKSFDESSNVNVNTGADDSNVSSEHEKNMDIHVTAQQKINWDTAFSHVSNTNNPHRITKATIGLSNVDNTRDIDKPISTAVENELTNYWKKTDNLGDYISRSEVARDYVKRTEIENIIREYLAGNPINTPIVPQPQPQPQPQPSPQPSPTITNNGISLTHKDQTYVLTVEQSVILYWIITKASGNLTRVNNVLSKTQLGVDSGVKSISNVNVFTSSKANTIAVSYKDRYSTTDIQTRVDEALREVG